MIRPLYERIKEEWDKGKKQRDRRGEQPPRIAVILHDGKLRTAFEQTGSAWETMHGAITIAPHALPESSVPKTVTPKQLEDRVKTAIPSVQAVVHVFSSPNEITDHDSGLHISAHESAPDFITQAVHAISPNEDSGAKVIKGRAYTGDKQGMLSVVYHYYAPKEEQKTMPNTNQASPVK